MHYALAVLIFFITSNIFSMIFPLPPAFASSASSSKEATSQLWNAAKFGSVEEVTRYISDGADVNDSSWSGYTPLMSAAQYNEKPEVLRVLIENGANVNAAVITGDLERYTVLMIAARYSKNPEVLSVLIEGGAKVNTVAWVKLIEYITLFSGCAPIEAGSDIRVKIELLRIYTPLMIAEEYNRNDKIRQILIENGASKLICLLLKVINAVLYIKWGLLLILPFILLFLWRIIRGRRARRS